MGVGVAAAGIENKRSLVRTMLLWPLKKGVEEGVDDRLLTMETDLGLDERKLQWI